MALNPNKKKYVNTTDLSLYLKRLSMAQSVMIKEEIANCRRNQTNFRNFIDLKEGIEGCQCSDKLDKKQKLPTS